MSKQEKIALIILLSIGFALRFFNFTEIPFTNDELSALNRLNYPNYSTMLSKAVWTDGHPAGVQTFLWFYVKLFGTKQWVIKLPFVFLGSLSLLFYFLAAKNLSNIKTALFALAFLATLQYPIIYSQTIRPYSSGQFLAAVCLYLWSLLINNKSTNHIYQVLFGIAIFLSISNHYFNLLFIALLFPTGFILKKNIQPINYIVPFVLGIILYIPQFPIFIHQISVGSPGWLTTPSINTVIKHFEYCFQFSRIYIILFPILFVIKMIKGSSDLIPKSKTWIWLSLYTAPILLSFVYSIYRAPIFQDSIFVFGFVFLFLFLGDILLSSNYNFKTMTIILSTIVCINVGILTLKRKHFQEYYHQGYSQLVHDTYQFQNKTSDIPTVVFGFEPYFFNYYKQANQTPNISQIQFLRDDFFAKTAKNPNDFIRILRKWNYKQMIVSNAIEIPQWAISALENEYPYAIKSFHFGSEVYLFSKENSIITNKSTYQPNSCIFINANRSLLSEENVPQNERVYSPTMVSINTVTSEKWISTTKIDIDSMRKYLGSDDYKHAIVKISASVQFVQQVTNIDSLLKTMNLVFTVTNKENQNIHFMNERFDRWFALGSNQFNCILTANCNHFEIDPLGSISTFIENNGNTPIKVTKFKVTVSQGNRHLYSLVNDF
jgi:hypothetical protein